MRAANIVVPVSIDAKIFRDFAFFDSFIRQKRWRLLALFTFIMVCSALLCFIFRSRVGQAALLGSVLAAVGLGLPAVYFFSFLSSVRQQCNRMHLNTQRHAYTITLSEAEGIAVKTSKELLPYRWEEVFAVYRVRNCTYLYVTQKKAFLLPDEQVEGGADALWELLESTVPAGRLLDRQHHTKLFGK